MKTGIRFLWFVGIVGFLLATQVVLANYENNKIEDERSNMWRSGAKINKDYMLPKDPAYDKTDMEESSDYHKTYYSPYAQLQVFKAVQINETKLPVGYYLVKLQFAPPASMGTLSSEQLAKQKKRWQKKPPDLNPSDPVSFSQAPQLSLIIKSQGEIQTTIPVVSSEKVETKTKRWQKKPDATAKWEIESDNPLNPQILSLKYCLPKMCYKSGPITPGLLQ